jgi:hypothetical protein
MFKEGGCFFFVFVDYPVRRVIVLFLICRGRLVSSYVSDEVPSMTYQTESLCTPSYQNEA